MEDILRDVDLNGDGLVDFEGKSLPQMALSYRVKSGVSSTFSVLTEFVRMMSH